MAADTLDLDHTECDMHVWSEAEYYQSRYLE